MDMRLEIVSPDGILFEGEAERVSFPGTAGSFDILPHHAPLIAALRQGTIQYEHDGKKGIEAVRTYADSIFPTFKDADHDGFPDNPDPM